MAQQPPRPTSRERRPSASGRRPTLRCYGAGMNFFWQLSGEEDAPRRSEVPIRLEWLEHMRPSALDSGSHFSYAVSEREGGAVYRWGTDNGKVYRQPERLTLPLPNIRAVAVACGNKHTLLLLEGGHVLSCGVGYFGQLGTGDDISSNRPRVIQSLAPQKLSGDRVVFVAAGGQHSGAITRTGEVYMWGFNRSGQCGVYVDKASNKGNTVSEPRALAGRSELIAPSGRPVQLVCGRHHSSLLTETGAVFSWGATSFGRLGIHDLSSKVVSSPQRVKTLDNFAVHAIASGDFHMLALTRDRRVFSWGYGAEGQCGHGNALHLRTPRPIEGLKHVLVSKIACGAWYSAAVSADGYLYTWGYGDGGWLGQSSDTTGGAGSVASGTKQQKRVMVEPGAPPTQKHGETCSFDSDHNNFQPALVTNLTEMQVTHVACGGSHTIALAIARDTLDMALAKRTDVDRPAATGTFVDGSDSGHASSEGQQLRKQQHMWQEEGTATQQIIGGREFQEKQQQKTLEQQQQQHQQQQYYQQHHRHMAQQNQQEQQQQYMVYQQQQQQYTAHQQQQQQQQQQQHAIHSTQQYQESDIQAEASQQLQNRSHSHNADGLLGKGTFGALKIHNRSVGEMADALHDEHQSGVAGVNVSVVDDDNGNRHVDGREKQEDVEEDEEDDDIGATIHQLQEPTEVTEHRKQLFTAMRHNRLEQITEALENGFNADDQDEKGNTLLFVACQNGLKNGAKLALRYGADLNTKNYSGNTPLHYCFKYGHNGLGAYLIKKGADDTATNAAGLTVYEGLSRSDVQ